MAIKKAKDLNMIGRMNEVSRLHFLGVSDRIIAREMEMPLSTVKNDVRQITDRIKEFDNIDEYLKDTIARLAEELTMLGEQQLIALKGLEYASEEIVQTDAMGKPLFVLDKLTGESTGVPQLGPRSPGQIIAYQNQITGIRKSKADLLRLMGPKVDITVKVQLQQKVMARIMEAMQGLSPDVYAQLHREIQIIDDTEKQLALTGDSIDAEFAEIEDDG